MTSKISLLLPPDVQLIYRLKIKDLCGGSDPYLLTKNDNDPLPRNIGSYSQGVQIEDVLYVSGNIGMTKDGVLAEGISNQTKLALDNVGFILEAAGVSFKNVIKVTVIMTDIQDYNEVNIVYGQYFSSTSPARSAFQVTNLPRGALVEIEAVAVVGEIIEESRTDNGSFEGKKTTYYLYILCLLLMTLLQ